MRRSRTSIETCFRCAVACCLFISRAERGYCNCNCEKVHKIYQQDMRYAITNSSGKHSAVLCKYAIAI